MSEHCEARRVDEGPRTYLTRSARLKGCCGWFASHGTTSSGPMPPWRACRVRVLPILRLAVVESVRNGLGMLRIMAASRVQARGTGSAMCNGDGLGVEAVKKLEVCTVRTHTDGLCARTGKTGILASRSDSLRQASTVDISDP